MKNPEGIKRYKKPIAIAFFISILLMAVPFVITYYFPIADNFLEKHSWLFCVFFIPIVLYLCIFAILTIFILVQTIFEEYHKDRESGSFPDEALIKIVFIIIFLIFLGFCSHGGGIWRMD